MSLKLMYITASTEVAVIAQKYGVDRIWVDMEYKGKEERQHGLNSVKNHHTVDDVRVLRRFITTSELLVRVNPWDDESQNEINAVIDAGADIIMLPMWKSVGEVQNFINAVGGRTKTLLLLETKEAVECLDDILALSGIDEIHIGLNDLSLSYGLSFMFELLSNGIVEMLTKKLKKAGIPYGFGGIAKIGEGDVPAEMIILEHYRLGSTSAILSRSFCNSDLIGDVEIIDRVFKENMEKLYEFEKYVAHVNNEVFLQNQIELSHAISAVVEKKKIK